MDNFKSTYILSDDMTFPKASVDPKLLRLQKEATEFITSTILKHEREFYQLVDQNFPGRLQEILGKTRAHIIEMISKTTSKFYNKIYYDVQHQADNGIVRIINDMCELAGYGPHILLDKMIRLTLDIHLEIPREKLVFQESNYDLYEKSVLMYLNLRLISHNFLHIFCKSDTNDNSDLVYLSDTQNAFDIVIDKNIGS